MPFAGVSEFTDAEIDSPAVDSESVRGLAQQAKRLARDHKTFFDFFASVAILGGGRQVLWLRIVGGPGCVPGSSSSVLLPERTSSWLTTIPSLSCGDAS